MKKKINVKKPLNVKKVTISKLNMTNVKGGVHDSDFCTGSCWLGVGRCVG